MQYFRFTEITTRSYLTMSVKPRANAYTVTEFLEKEFEESDDVKQHCSRCIADIKLTVNASIVRSPPVMVSIHQFIYLD